MQSDGGAFPVLCSMIGTDYGKTVVMARIVARSVLNKATNLPAARFTRNVRAVAPGVTLRSRLAVIEPSCAEDYRETLHVGLLRGSTGCAGARCQSDWNR